MAHYSLRSRSLPLAHRLKQGDALEGAGRVRTLRALFAWVALSVDYDCGASGGAQGAEAVLAARAGVCAGFAHLLAALAERAGIPARVVPRRGAGCDLSRTRFYLSETLSDLS